MQLSDVDLMEDTWSTQVPHETFDLLRREAPVFWHDLHGEKAPGFWAVTRHADVRAISRDTATYSSEAMGTFISDPTPEGLAAMRMTLLNMDPPRHNRYRRLVSRGFTPRVIRALEEQIVERARRIVDEVCEKGEIDFVGDVAVYDEVLGTGTLVGFENHRGVTATGAGARPLGRRVCGRRFEIPRTPRAIPRRRATRYSARPTRAVRPSR